MAETVLSLRVEVIIKGTVAGDDGAVLRVDEHYTQVFSDGTGTDQIGNVVQDLNRPLNSTKKHFTTINNPNELKQGMYKMGVHGLMTGSHGLITTINLKSY